MDNINLTSTENTEVSSERAEALALHQRLLVNANTAVACWVETCKDLKQMRDGKLYIALGYETFSDYTEQALGIKERQAYTYIQTLEKLGGTFLQSNAELGITKLSLITAVPVMERQDLIDSNDIAGMTVAEVKALVAENNGRGEQISLLTEQVDALRGEAAEKEKDIDYAEQRISELEKELENERSKPIEVAVQEPSEEQMNEIRADALKEAEKQFKADKKALSEKYKAEKEKALSEAKEKAEKELAEYKSKLAELDGTKTQAAEQVAELQKKLAVASSPETVKFTFFFDSLQADYEKIFDSLKKIREENPDVAAKYSAALCKYQQLVGDQLAELY